MAASTKVVVQAEQMIRKLQNSNLPFSAFDVTRILTGPAIVIEKINPPISPMIDIVIRLSINNLLNYLIKRFWIKRKDISIFRPGDLDFFHPD